MDIPENLPSNFLSELEKLKQEVREIKQLQGLGESIAEEIQREVAEKLDIPHLRDKPVSKLNSREDMVQDHCCNQKLRLPKPFLRVLEKRLVSWESTI
jgi:hypothetical protein